MRKCWNLTQIVKEEKTNLGCNYLKARTRKRYISQKNRFRDKFLNGDSHSQSPLNILQPCSTEKYRRTKLRICLFARITMLFCTTQFRIYDIFLYQRQATLPITKWPFSSNESLGGRVFNLSLKKFFFFWILLFFKKKSQLFFFKKVDFLPVTSGFHSRVLNFTR